MRSILEFDNIVRSYTPGVPVLNGVTTSRYRMVKLYSLVRRNGAGKTTFIRMAMGMLHSDARLYKSVRHGSGFVMRWQ